MGILILLFCTGCFGPAPAAQFVQQAQKLHDQAIASAVAPDPDLRDYIQLVGGRIAKAAHDVDPGVTSASFYSRIEFHLLASPVPNALTTGGSHIYVYNGLFQACKSEGELAAAIAHAFVHEMNLDVEHVGIRPDVNATPPMIAWQFVTHRFTLEQEQAADRRAFDILVKAGYDPNQFADLFEHLRDLYPRLQAPDRTPLIVRAQQARQWARQELLVRPALPVADPKTFLSLRREAALLNPDTGSQLIIRALPNCMLGGDTPDQQTAQQQLRPPEPVRRLEPS